jgi:SNF2 family DNA or RNA helicase
MWSQIPLDQFVGRAHRIGQEDIVHLFVMVGMETVDVLMVNQSYAKGSLLDSFLHKGKNTGK